MNPIFLTVFVCVLSGKAFTANIDEACANDAACTPTNSHCEKEFTGCNGKCKCNDGFTGNSEDTACLTDTALDGACSATTNCLYGASCDTGGTDQCKCSSGSTYNSLVKMCITTGTKAISETCTAETECIGYSATTADNKVECVAASGSTTKYCRCLSGFITENGACRKPYVTEACTSSVGCVLQADISDSSQETETCQTNTCACPSTADKLSLTTQGTTYNLCFTKYTQTLKDNDATCTASNECTSKYCGTCPGETAKKCLKLASGAAKISAISLPFMMVATLLTFVL